MVRAGMISQSHFAVTRQRNSDDDLIDQANARKSYA